jgi:hypothetical protein
MATNGLQDLVLTAEEKRCSRAVGWKVTLKIFEISTVDEKGSNFENGRYDGLKGELFQQAAANLEEV